MKKLLIVFVLSVAAISLNAQTTESLSFTRIERNPRAAGLAGAGSASVTNVAFASFGNAAVVPFYEQRADFSLAYQYWRPANAINGGFSFRLSNVVGLTVGSAVQFEKPDDDGFIPTSLQINLGAGFRILPWFGLGVNMRLAQDYLFKGRTYSGFAADAMALFNPVRGLTISAGVANLGTNIKSFSGKEFPQPVSLKLAAAYYLPLGTKNSLEFMLDEDYFINTKSSALSVGVEYSFNKTLYARTGYRYATTGAEYGSHLGLGLGVQFFGFRLDVSYLTLSEAVGNSFAVGLGYRF